MVKARRKRIGLQACLGAPEQGGPQSIFQFLNRGRDGRLANTVHAGGLAECAGLEGAGEIAESVQVKHSRKLY